MYFESVFEELDGAYADNTIRSYKNDINRFSKWLRDMDIEPQSTDYQNVIDYLEFGCTDLSSASIQRNIAAIGTIYSYAGLTDPTKHPKVKLSLRKLNRIKGNFQSQAKPLTRALLEKLLQHCDPETVLGKRDSLLLELGYQTLRRRSELVSFEFTDLRKSSEGEYGLILRRSKTDPFGYGKIIRIDSYLFNKISEWRSVVGEGRILRSIRKNGEFTTSLSADSINRILKRLEGRSGREPSQLSGHSFRVGRTVDLIDEGFSAEQIALMGGWKSPEIVLRYGKSWRDLFDNDNQP